MPRGWRGTHRPSVSFSFCNFSKKPNKIRHKIWCFTILHGECPLICWGTKPKQWNTESRACWRDQSADCSSRNRSRWAQAELERHQSRYQESDVKGSPETSAIWDAKMLMRSRRRNYPPGSCWYSSRWVADYGFRFGKTLSFWQWLWWGYQATSTQNQTELLATFMFLGVTWCNSATLHQVNKLQHQKAVNHSM